MARKFEATADLAVTLTRVAVAIVISMIVSGSSETTPVPTAFAGLVHGYALGESIAGAEPAPLYAYFVGLAVIQATVALACMAIVRLLAARTTAEPAVIRSLGVAVIAVGLVVLVQQIVAAA